MATYQVMMTLEVPQLRLPRTWEIELPGRRAHLRVYGSAGRLAVNATVREEAPGDAAIVVAQAVMGEWKKSDGPIKVLKWTAHRSRVFAGLGRHPESFTSSHRPWGWHEGPDDEGGSAGVREPRRPLPGPGSMSAALELPRD
jgi:hypothetical protein